ncbi:thioredoxin, partial [Thiolapillus sp.]
MSTSPYIIEITKDNYQTDVIERSAQVPVLVDFWAPWCQPCKILMPVLANLAEQYGEKFILAKINTEEEQELAAQFAIRSIPTVKLFVNGQPVDEFAGALPEADIR